MRISIVTISYNQARFLRECMKSVLDQDGSDIEYIVVDPGSTDGSREIIESYGTRVIRVFEKDSGAADGLNKGFERATGDVFGFLNSDDTLLPSAVRTVSDYLDRNHGVAVVSGCGYFTDVENRRVRRIVPSKFLPWLYVHGGVSVFQQGTFFRSEYFRKVNGFNIQNKTCWDGELFLDMAMAGARFSTIGSDLALFRLHDGGITGSGRLNTLYRVDSERLFKKLLGRERNAMDRVWSVVARCAKGIVDPAYFFRCAASAAMLQDK